MRQRLKPDATRPPDFEAFWEKTRAELASVEPALERAPVEDGSTDEIALESISFRSLGSAEIHGYILRWHDQQSRPVVVHGHGYGGAATIEWAWARRGLHVVGIDLRGFGRSRNAVPKRSPWGYVLTGAQSPEHSILRGAISDYIRAVELAGLLVGADVSHLVAHGASFTGGLALMAEAVAPAADLLAVETPTFGWAEGRNFFAQSGSGAEISRFLRARPYAAEDLMLVLRYFDTMNFAELVSCPTLVGVGLEDAVVPAKTVFAIANHIQAPHEVMEFPVSHSDSPEMKLWAAFDDRWIDLALQGVPTTFGQARTSPDRAESLLETAPAQASRRTG